MVGRIKFTFSFILGACAGLYDPAAFIDVNNFFSR